MTSDVPKRRKLVRYDPKHLSIWRAVFTVSKTILTHWDTWYHLGVLTLLCAGAATLVIVTGGFHSIPLSDVTSRIQTLLSFVLAGYVAAVISRWNTLRNTTLGALWGALENTVLLSFRIFKGNSSHEIKYKNDCIRYARGCLLLTFYAARGQEDISKLYTKGLLTPDEGFTIESMSTGTRPLVIVGWLRYIKDISKNLLNNSFYPSLFLILVYYLHLV